MERRHYLSIVIAHQQAAVDDQQIYSFQWMKNELSTTGGRWGGGGDGQRPIPSVPPLHSISVQRERGQREASGTWIWYLFHLSMLGDVLSCLPCLPLLRSSIHPQSIQFQNIVIRTSRWSQPTGIAFQQQGRPSTPLSSSLFFQGIHHNASFPGFFF